MKIFNRRYLGAKTKLLPFIEEIINNNCEENMSIVDLFAGTGSVGYHFNNSENKIIMNDLLYSNYLSYLAWLSSKNYDTNKINFLIAQYNNIDYKEGDENYFSKNFGNNFFTNENAFLIGEIRENIEKDRSLEVREKAILITSLIYATDKVANTFGHYEAYRKILDTSNRLILSPLEINDADNKNNEIYQMNANDLVRKIKADIFYIDPPYNSRQYGDAYHLLENIAKWEKPEVFGVAKKMANREHGKSEYCKINAAEYFNDLITNINGKYILVSYNNMGEKGSGRSQAKLSDDDILSALKKRGDVQIFESDFKYFTTGKTNLENHKERVFLCKILN